MATISTSFYSRLRVWPIVMIVQTYGNRRKNIDNFGFLMLQRKIGQGFSILSYFFKHLNEITSFFFCWEGNIIWFSCIMFTGLYVVYSDNLSLHTLYILFSFKIF